MAFYKKSMLNDTSKVANVDVYITKYVRNIDLNEFTQNITIFEKVINKLAALNFEKHESIFHGNAGNTRYSDTIFGAITIGMAINKDKLPTDDNLIEKINSLPDNADFQKFYKRGYSAAGRIVKMLDFCSKYFKP